MTTQKGAAPAPLLTPESEEMLRQLAWVVEQVRAESYPDMVGQPIDQTQARAQLALIEEAARRNAEAQRDRLRNALDAHHDASNDLRVHEAFTRGDGFCPVCAELRSALTDDQEGET